MTTVSEFNTWAAELRATRPELFTLQRARKGTARRRWHPLFLRVYGIKPWEMGRYTLGEYGALVDDLKENGLGGGFGR